MFINNSGHLVFSDELYHHGILGMKWGIRRFQPYPKGHASDGKFVGKSGLTRSGRKKLKSYTNSKEGKLYRSSKDSADKIRKELKIVKVDDNTDLIQKGRTLNRVSGEEGLDSRRKYMSIGNSRDSVDYLMSAYEDMLPIEGKKYQYTYELKKDIKVAPAETVKSYILEKYGRRKVKDMSILQANAQIYGDEKIAASINKAIKKLENVKIKSLMKDIDDYETLSYMSEPKDIKIDKNIRSIAMAASHIYSDFLNRSMMQDKNISDDILKEFKNRGYDAIIDPEDTGTHQYPLVVIDPEEVLKVTNKRAL